MALQEQDSYDSAYGTFIPLSLSLSLCSFFAVFISLDDGPHDHCQGAAIESTFIVLSLIVCIVSWHDRATGRSRSIESAGNQFAWQDWRGTADLGGGAAGGS